MNRRESGASRTDRTAGIIISIITAAISVMVLVAAYMPIYCIGETKYGSREISLITIVKKLYYKLITLDFIKGPTEVGMNKVLEFVIFMAGSIAIIVIVIKIIISCIKRAIVLTGDVMSRLTNMEEAATQAFGVVGNVLLLKLVALLGISMYYWMNEWDSISMINILTRAENMSFWWKLVLIISVANVLMASIYYGLVHVLRNINVTARMVDIVMGNLMYLFGITGFIYSTYPIFAGVIGRKVYGNIGVSYIIPSIQNVVENIGKNIKAETGNYDIYLMFLMLLMFFICCLSMINIGRMKNIILDEETSMSSSIIINVLIIGLSVGAFYLLGMTQNELKSVMNGELKPALGLIVPGACGAINIFFEIIRRYTRR